MTGSSIRASHDGARLEVWRKVQLSARSGDYRSEPLATFELRLVEDLDPETGLAVAVEVVLLKSAGDGTSAGEQEAIYSETITEGE